MGLIDRFRLRLLFDKGVRAAERGDHDDALVCFQEVLDQDPDYALAHSNMGYCLFELGRAQDALDAYDQAIQLDPQDAQCVYDLGCILYKMERYQEAAERFDAALLLDPEFPDARLGLRKAQQKLNPDAYRDEAPAAEKKPPQKPAPAPPPKNDLEAIEHGNVEALTERGHEYYENNEFGKALEVWRRGIAASPKSASLHNNCAAALFHLGRLDEAIAACNLALTVDPEYAVALMTRGEILLEQGNVKSARKDLEALRKLDEEMADELEGLIHKKGG